MYSIPIDYIRVTNVCTLGVFGAKVPPTMAYQSHSVKRRMIAISFDEQGIIESVILDTHKKITTS